MAQSLLELPLEMRHHILSFVDPEDLPRISFVCKELRQYLKVNKQLDRDIVLRVLVCAYYETISQATNIPIGWAL
jgi:hypothetical protein